MFTDLTIPQIQNLVTGIGAPKYRAKQLLHWVYRKLALSWDEMTDLPKPFRQTLAERVALHGLSTTTQAESKDGTIKVLFALQDNRTVEANYMPYPSAYGSSRNTLCVSTQVGCPIACPFCATGNQGFERNLSPGEIIDQVLFFARLLNDTQSGEHITNIVFMGMGEPLANYNNLRQAIEMLNSPDSFGLGARHMTISTSGLIPQIKLLSRETLQVNLAISLHAADNKLRSRLVPINHKYPLDQLIPACREYIAATNRRISFEYILFEGINDSLVQARSLAHLVAGLNCHVNLITANKTTGTEFKAASPETVRAFERELNRLHIPCTVRQSRGTDIDAGCGQLRSRYLSRK